MNERGQIAFAEAVENSQALAATAKLLRERAIDTNRKDVGAGFTLILVSQLR
jgi:hypothetical protein